MRLYRQERYDEAAQRLQGVLQQQPDDPLLHYDLGTVAYGKGDYQASEEAFNKALAAADAGLLGRTWYNLGNTHYRLGQTREATAPSEAVALYRKALDDYRMAIRSDPNDHDARYNYELVERRMKSLMQRQQESGDRGQGTGDKNQNAEGSQQRAVNGEGGESSSDGAKQEQQAVAVGEGEKGEPSQEAGAGDETSASDAAGQEQKEEQQEADQQKAVGSQQETGDRKGEGGRKREEQTSSGAGGKEMSPGEALWILDAAQQEERRAPTGRQQGVRRERPVEQDW